MTNHQCYCYGIVALQRLINANVEICSDNFYSALCDLWDIFSEENIESIYEYMNNSGEIL